MNNSSNIRDLIYTLVGGMLRQEELYVRRGTVTNINDTDWTADVTPIDGGADIKGVKLKPVLGGSPDGIVVVPVDGSIVSVAFESKTKAYLLHAEDVDRVIIRGGALGGLIKIADLVDKLNALEEKVNDLVTYSATHTHSGVTAGAGTSGAPVTPVTGSLTLTQAADIEDENVKH